MPAVSRSQQRLFAIAEHEPGKLHKQNKKLASLSHKVLHEFASGSTKGKPMHVKGKNHFGQRAAMGKGR
jgi:hypothetical protein